MCVYFCDQLFSCRLGSNDDCKHEGKAVQHTPELGVHVQTFGPLLQFHFPKESRASSASCQSSQRSVKSRILSIKLKPVAKRFKTFEKLKGWDSFMHSH